MASLGAKVLQMVVWACAFAEGVVPAGVTHSNPTLAPAHALVLHLLLIGHFHTSVLLLAMIPLLAPQPAPSTLVLHQAQCRPVQSRGGVA